MRMPGANDDENYMVDHSSSILALNPKGELAAFISPPHTPENILKALKAIQK
jgi:cytochrome oxidase Cu insertion factor (SCO1/SenC/PrrC family)